MIFKTENNNKKSKKITKNVTVKGLRYLDLA